jgi:heterodisulfide reductase subunit C
VAPTANVEAPPRPGELGATESALRRSFLAEIERIPGGDRLRRCIQCGTCSGSCPVSYAMDVQPRQLVALFRAGDLGSILRSRTIWICSSCYACTVRCPAGIKITDLIYGLKRMAIEKRMRARGLPIPALSRLFVRQVKRWGRNQELKLVRGYLLRMAPWRLPGLLPIGWRLLRAGRLPWRTQRIRGIGGLRRIIAKARAMEHAWPRETARPLGRVGYGLVAERSRASAGGPR